MESYQNNVYNKKNQEILEKEDLKKNINKIKENIGNITYEITLQYAYIKNLFENLNLSEKNVKLGNSFPKFEEWFNHNSDKLKLTKSISFIIFFYYI